MLYYKLLFINKSCLQSAQKVFCSGYLKTAGYTYIYTYKAGHLKKLPPSFGYGPSYC